MTTEDLFWLSVNAYHEARGESYEGIKAVCMVAMNRCERRKKTIKQVVLQPYQFSWTIGDQLPSIKDYDSFLKCMQVAKDAFEDYEKGERMNGADHYHATYINQPSWAREMTFIAQIGHHIFYRS